MSEGASGGGGAPSGAGGAAAAGGAAGTPPATVTSIPKPAAAKAPAKGAKPAEPADSGWSDKDESELFEKFKRAPWAKVKANGGEKAITSREEFLAMATDASRARGYNKLVEQTKKEAAEAKAIKEEHAAHKALLERARRGDVQARRELGLVPDTERAQLEKEWAALTPAQQELHRRNHELEEKLSAVERKEQEDKAKAAETKRNAERTKTMGEARQFAKEILKDVKEELVDVELPEIIGAMRVLRDAGQRIGRDYTTEQLTAYVQQRRAAALESRIGTLKPEAALRHVLPHLKQLVATPEGLEQLEQVLGVDFEAIAGALSGRRLAKWRQGKQKAALSGEVKKPGPRDDAPKSNPLPHFRF